MVSKPRRELSRPRRSMFSVSASILTFSSSNSVPCNWRQRRPPNWYVEGETGPLGVLY
jgi:hypothetical protein